MRRIMLGVGWVAGIVVIGALLLDEGQVVTLVTHEDGREYKTQVWIVAVEESFYVRSNQSDSEWLERIDSDPKVGIKWRDQIQEEVVPFQVRRVRDAALSDRVSGLLARKHGFADRVRSFFVDRQESVVLELVPAEESRASIGAAALRGADS